MEIESKGLIFSKKFLNNKLTFCQNFVFLQF